MSYFGRLPKLLIIFWLIQCAIIIILWKVLPHQPYTNVLWLLLVVNAGLIYFRQFELPILTNVTLILALANLWRGVSYFSPILNSALIFLGVALTGLIAASTFEPIERENLLAWFLIGLFTAEIATLVDFWPITFLQKSVLCTDIFYFVWQLWPILSPAPGSSRRPILGHFIFVALAVMVVLANIIWITWPGLKTF